MKFGLSSRQTAEYLKQADEIVVNYKDHKIIPQHIERYPQARINLALPYDQKEKIDFSAIADYYNMAKGNFILGVVNGEQLGWAREKLIPAYHRALLHTFQELRDMVAAGVEEVILGAPLFFQLDKIRRHFPNVKVRATANVALPEGTMCYNNGVAGIWIRPEDVELYSEYIDTLTFYGTITEEQALYRIYALQHKWPGNINLIIKDLDSAAVNRMIPPTLGEARINCGQKCMENGICHLCQRMLDLANPDIMRKILEDREQS